jgi:hypothetical protein
MAQPKKTKLPIDILIKHLYFHKDAVIVLGPDILENTKAFEINESTYDSYNRKLMMKNPKEFWQFYMNNIVNPYAVSNKITKELNKFLELGLHSAIIDTNIIKTVYNHNVISPNGKNDTLECVRCHKTYDPNKMVDQLMNQEKVLKCECGGNIKPTVLYHGEKYSMPLYNAVKNAVFKEVNGEPKLNTHTLIFIGVDFTDSLISELIDSYDAIKTDNFLTVIMTDKLNRDDCIYYSPEFGVADDLDKALIRLMDLLKQHD